MQVRFTVEYDGTNYAGWQLQTDKDSVQGRLEAALTRIFSSHVRVRGAGRTDAGVHALGQVAAAYLPRPFPSGELRRALNALLPHDIAVHDVAEAGDGFDPRRDADSRVYEYHVINRAERSAFAHRYAWLVREPLNFDALGDAARVILGRHDFEAFRSTGSDEKSTIRNVIESRWTRDGEHLVYHIEANGFLRHMVRTLAAAMIEAGRGRLTIDAVRNLLQTRNRALAPAPAPAAGLFLILVRYPASAAG